MQVVHEYLWYLAYGRPDTGIENVDFDKVHHYNNESSWKTYLPPVPSHPNYGKGWVQVGDAAVILPLSILAQFHRYTYKVDGLERYLADSNKRDILVRHLPHKMRELLLHKRKYLFSLMEVIERLCFMGLVTLSRQKATSSCLPKEEEMVYVHRNASFLDTRISNRSYMEISSNMTYDKIELTLDEFEDVGKYWIRLKDICLMTPLGNRRNG
uniref:Uncharacterized protein n=1 Tax=Ciona savignyi TaxID=51511 RepID=H2Y5U0_CIOSA